MWVFPGEQARGGCSSQPVWYGGASESGRIGDTENAEHPVGRAPVLSGWVSRVPLIRGVAFYPENLVLGDLFSDMDAGLKTKGHSLSQGR